MTKTPQLSIIIASYNSENTIEGCLNSLKNQRTDKAFEVIVIDTSTDGTAKLVEERFLRSPKVKLYRFSERKYPGGARNFGISKAKGGILAFTDTDCVVEENWVDEILIAHEKYPDHPVIGGTVGNGNPEKYVGWGAYFCEFSQWMPQPNQSQMVEIPACCLSIKRWAFDKYGPFLENGYCSDTAFHWRLVNDGFRSLLIPSIKMRHKNISSFKKFIEKGVMHGRFFAEVRVLEQQFSVFKKMAFAVMSPLLPLILFYRTTTRVFKNRIYIKQFILSSPLVFLGLISWSLGECIGYGKG